MSDYIFAQRSTQTVMLTWKSQSTGNAVPVPEDVVSVASRLGVSGNPTTSDVAISADLSGRSSGIIKLTLTDEITGAMRPDVEHTLDCLATFADGSRQRLCKLTLVADKTRTP